MRIIRQLPSFSRYNSYYRIVLRFPTNSYHFLCIVELALKRKTENMACDLRQCNFSSLFRLFS